MSDDHEWCRDTAREEAVRAAEDAAAVPAILHRDLPDAVAELRERVARLEAVIRAAHGAKQEPVAWGVLSAGEIVQVSLWQWRDSSVSWSQRSGGTVVPLYAAPPEPRGWLTAEEREAVAKARKHFDNQRGEECVFIARTLTAFLARSTPPRVKVPKELQLVEARGVRIVYDAAAVKKAIRAAGGEVEG